MNVLRVRRGNTVHEKYFIQCPVLSSPSLSLSHLSLLSATTPWPLLPTHFICMSSISQTQQGQEAFCSNWE